MTENQGGRTTSRERKPPWKRTGHVLCFLLALCAAGWLTLHMPAPHRAVSPGVAISRQDAAPRPLPSAGQPTAETDRPPIRMMVAPGRADHSDAAKLLSKLPTFGRLFIVVGLAAFLGGIIDGRRWHMALARYLGRLTRMARLPEIVGLAMPAALCSNAAANSMLMTGHAEGKIGHSALIAGGMVNSYLAYVSHSLRVMYPVVGAIGLPGLLYFTVQFTGGLLVILGVLLWNRRHVSRLEAMSEKGELHEKDYGTTDMEDPLPWAQTLRRAGVRSASLLFRMVCLTVPLMLGMEWLLKSGALDFWERHVPERVALFFPSELLSVVAAQMGGLVQSAAVAANLRAEGLVDNAQILLAMLAASAVGNPVRTLRRNLPSALGIFPPPAALVIVLGMQFARLATTLLAIMLIVFCMRSFLY